MNRSCGIHQKFMDAKLQSTDWTAHRLGFPACHAEDGMGERHLVDDGALTWWMWSVQCHKEVGCICWQSLQTLHSVRYTDVSIMLLHTRRCDNIPARMACFVLWHKSWICRHVSALSSHSLLSVSYTHLTLPTKA